MTEEAKESVVEEKQSIAESTREEAGDKMDDILDDYEKGLATDSVTSTDVKATDDEVKDEEAVVDPDNAKKEADSEETKESEGEIPEEFHKHPAWMKQRDKLAEAQKETEELRSKLSAKETVDVKEITSSAEYIRASMERAGYKEEAIQSALSKAGHVEPATQQDIIDTVIDKLGYNKANLTQEQLDYIHDISKVSNIIAEQHGNPELSGRLEAVESVLAEEKRKESGRVVSDEIVKTVESEGILDMKVDIEPRLHEFIDNNPEAQQLDVLNYFRDLNHKLVLERSALAQKKAKRDDEKSVLKQNTHSVGKAGVSVPDKTGDPNVDADNFLDSVGMLS